MGRVITPLWGNSWLPLKLINPRSETMILKRNSKIADVSPCITFEKLASPDTISIDMQSVSQQEVATRSPEQMVDALKNLGLQDLNLRCQTYGKTDCCDLLRATRLSFQETRWIMERPWTLFTR